MREIDFVPDWYRASQRRRSDLAVRITCLCVLAGAMVVWSMRNLAVVTAAETNLAIVRQDYQSQDEPLQQLAGLRSRLSELRERRALLQTVRGGARASEVLAEVTRLMPEAMVLTSVSVNRERRLPPADAPAGEASPSLAGLSGRLEIEGMAASNADVGAFHTALVESPCFQNVRMLYARPTVQAGHKGRQFRLTCRLPRFE